MGWARYSSGVCLMLVSLGAAANAILPPLQIDKLDGYGGWFGTAIAVDGDTAVVGAHQSGGEAYVFVREDGTWLAQETLEGSPSTLFGSAVAVEGDTAVVGAPLASVDGLSSGTVAVFTRSGSRWTQTATLVPSDGARRSWFGGAVAIDGGTILVGARDHLEAGAAYVFTGAGNAWTEVARLVPYDTNRNARFGAAVDLEDGTAVIGARGDSAGGAAYVYSGADGTWAPVTKLTAPDGMGGDFGFPVALDGDTALIGAMEQGAGDPYWGTGAAYVFTETGGSWRPQAKLTSEDASAGDLFGRSVAIEGDVAIIGAAGVDDQASKSGAAYVFRRTENSWSQLTKLLPDRATENARFGSAVALEGRTALIGAPLMHAAYVFDLDPAKPRLQCPGDINGDGLADVVVVGSDGLVTVKGLDGALVNQFQLDDSSALADTRLLPDINGNGAPELLALNRTPAVEVRDLLSSGSLGWVELVPWQIALNLYVIDDFTGNGSPEFVTLGWAPGEPARGVALIEVHDAVSGARYSQGQYGEGDIISDLAFYPDLDGNAEPEVALLGDSRRTDWADRIQLKTLSGWPLRDVWLGRHWRMLQQVQIADQTGNGLDELAVLRVRGDRVNVQIRDPMTGSRVNYVGFARDYPPIEMLAVADLNDNGADELALLGRRLDGRNQKVVIKDSRTGQKLRELWFDRAFPARDMAMCGDLDGNGSEEVAVLGQRISDGASKVIIKDAGTGERIVVVSF